MNWANVVSILVAILAAAAAYASQRSAAKASVINTQTVSAVDREKEAYERARAFDTETILRQDKEIEELRARVLVAEAEAKAARVEAAAAKKESEEVRIENLKLRDALNEFLRNRPNNPHL